MTSNIDVAARKWFWLPQTRRSTGVSSSKVGGAAHPARTTGALSNITKRNPGSSPACASSRVVHEVTCVEATACEMGLSLEIEWYEDGLSVRFT
jgi:hypothetical protein